MLNPSLVPGLTRSRRMWLLAGSIAVLSVTTGCRHGDVLKELPQEISDVLPVGEKRPLEVVLASPQGVIKGTEPGFKTVSIAFNQPMVPLQPVALDLNDAPMKIEPAVKGHFRWKGTATLTFEANDPMPFGTHYKVTIPAGTRSWSGQSLDKDYVFEFTTPVAGLVGSLPVATTVAAAPDGPIYLHFNRPMDPATAASLLSLECKGQAVPFDVRAYKTEDIEAEGKRNDPEGYPSGGSSAYFQAELIPDKNAPSDQILVVVPKSAMPKESEVTLILKAGLKGKQGQVGLEHDQKLNFTTYGLLECSGASEQNAVAPEDGLSLKFTNGVAPSDLAKHIKIEPKIEMPSSAEGDTYASDTPVLYVSLKPRTTYTVTLDAGLKDRFGQTLGKDVTVKITTADSRASLNMPDGLGRLESQGPLRVPMGIVNVQNAEVQLAKLNRNALVATLEKEDVFYAKAFTPPGGYSRKIAIPPSSQPNKMEERSVDFTAADGPYIFLQVSSNALETPQRSLVMVSNIGLTCKSSPENCIIWATTLKDAKPLNGAEVEIRDRTGAVLWTGKTGANGTVQSPGWAALGTKKKEEYQSAPELYIFAKVGGDETMIRSSGEHSISPSEANISFDYSQQARSVKGYAFSERGLYKPGETVQLKGSIRELKSSQWTIPDIKEFPYAIEDSRGNIVTKGTVKLNEFGAFNHSVTLTDQAPTGAYAVSYQLPPSIVKELKLPRSITGTGFQVETFRPAQFEVTVKPDKAYYVMGDKAKAVVKGWYLFGAPMNESAVKWTASIEPTSLPPDGEAFQGYSFGPDNPNMDDSKSDTAKKLTQQSTTLDAQGLKTVDVNLDNISYQGSANLVIEGTIRSAGRQELAGRAVVPLHRGDFQIGLRGSSAVGKAGEKFKLEGLAVNPAGKLVAGQKIKLELLRREWKSVRKAGVDGRYQWISEVKDESVSAQEFTSGQEAAVQELTPLKAGYYVVHATAEDGRKNKIITDTSFYVSGTDYVGWERKEGDEIKLVSDKKGYKPGDTAKILVQNPFEGKTQALVTLEREHILEQYVQEVEGSTPTLDVPLSSKHMPNVYVSVVLIKGRLADKGFGPDGDDLGKPSFRIGYCNLPVLTTQKKLTVTVKTDKESYQPGEEVTVNADVKDSKGQGVSAEFSLAAADVGVLDLIHFQTPNYFDAFYGIRSLGVATTETRLDVIGQRVYGTKGASPGGGGSDESSLRQDFKFTAYWDPSVRTDGQGHATLKFKLPDNLTTFRLMAVAQTQGSDFGSGEAKFAVKKSLMLQPTLPLFARVGDDFSAGVVVHNNTSASLTTDVELKATNVPVVGESHQSVTVDAGKEKEVLFHFKPEKAEIAELTFSAKAGDSSDSLRVKLPQQLAVTTETVATSGSTTAPAAVELVVPGPIAPGTGFLQVNVASSALIGLEGAALFNLGYGFDCLEQRMSKTMPLLASQKLISGLNLKDYNGTPRKDLIKEQIKALPSFQAEGGGFRLWPDSTYDVNDFVTAYVLEVMAGAKAQGFPVDEAIIKKATGYLKKVIADQSQCKLPYTIDEQWVNKTYALYALSLWDVAEVSDLNRFYSGRSQMSLTAKAYLLQAAYRIDGGQPVVAGLRQDLKNAIQLEASTAHFSERKDLKMPWIYSSARQVSALVLKALLEGKDSFELAPKVVNWLLESRAKDGSFGDTHTNTEVLQAFGVYLDKFEKDTPDFTAKVKLGSQELLSQAFKGRNAPAVHKLVPLKESDDKVPVSFEKDGPGRLYYDLRMTYATLKAQPARDEGLAVFKSISDVKTGAKLAEFKAGETYMVTLSLVTPTERHYVVLSDPIPAGFEVVQTNFDSESQEMREILNRANQKTPGYTFSHFEKYQDRVLLFADGLQAGEHTFRYLLRANQPGIFLMPPSKSEEMYHPEVFGTTAATNITIK